MAPSKRAASSSKLEDSDEVDSPAFAQSKGGAKRQKTEATDADGDPDEKKGRTVKPWSQAEELALRRAMLKTCLSNLGELAKEPGLEKRNTGKINMKLRGIAKTYDKQYGGDGKWIDRFVKFKKTS